MIDNLPLFAAALVTGLLGSTHCLGMCAGISAIIAVGGTGTPARASAAIALAYNAGRITSYAILGAAVAALGAAFVDTIPVLAAPVRFLSGAIIVLIGLQVALQLPLLAPLERAGLKVWQRVQPLARRFLPVTNLRRAAGLGLAWGLLPCGLVYSVLLVAATSADVTSGAATMLAFGAGTMPAMVATGLGAMRLSALAGRSRRWLGMFIVVIGLATMAVPVRHLVSTDPGAHHGHTSAILNGNAIGPAALSVA